MKPSASPGVDLDEAFRLHSAELLRVAAFVLGDRGAAEDVVQDVFVRMHEREDLMNGDPQYYLRAAVMNGCRSTLRRWRLIRRHAERQGQQSACPPLTAEEAALLGEDRKRVLAALAALPPRRREVLVLRFYLEMSEAEIARTLGISPGTDRTAAQLRDALRAAADVMAATRAVKPQRMRHVRRDQRARGRLFPLAAAVGVVVIALGTLFIAHLVSSAGKPAAGSTSGQAGSRQTPAAAPGGPRPEFYLTATYPASGPNVLQFQVRRTDGGAVTDSTSIPGSNQGWSGHLSVAAGDRAFYLGEYPCTRSARPLSAIPRTTFYRITITGSGRISGMAPVGRPVEGMVTTLAVSPDGSRMAYSALQHACAGPITSLKDRFKGAGSVNVTDLSTGTMRTWPDATSPDRVSRLSWAQDGRTLIVDENPAGPRYQDLTVFGLDTTSGGGSLQAHSTTLLRQAGNCSPCVRTALAGPRGSLTVLEAEPAGLRARVSVVSIPSGGGSRTVLFSGDLYDTGGIDLFADPSGQWVLLWPTSAVGTPEAGPPLPSSPAGWISGGRLHPLPGIAQVYPQGIAW